MTAPRTGSRALAPVRGRVVGTRGEATTIETDRGETVEVPVLSVRLAVHEKIRPCPCCGLPMFRGGVCWTCRLIAEHHRTEETIEEADRDA